MVKFWTVRHWVTAVDSSGRCALNSGNWGNISCLGIFEFSAEGLSENAKTISLSTQEQKILKFVTNKSQEVLKSFAESPKSLIYMSLVSDLLNFCFQIIHF